MPDADNRNENENGKSRSRRSKKNKAEGTAAATDAAADVATSGAPDSQASVRDLVSDATDAMSLLSDDVAPPAAAAEVASVDNMTGDDSASEMSAAEVSETTDRLVSAIDWNEDMEDLAFTDADGAESELQMDANDAIVAELAGQTAAVETEMSADGEAMSLDGPSTDAVEAAPEVAAEPVKPKKKSVKEQLADVSDRSERLQELARMVAKTVSERKAEQGDDEAAPAVEADGTTAPEQQEPEQMGFQALEEELDAADNDADPEPTEFVDNDHLISIVESMLFSTDKPVSLATIKALFKGTNIRTKDIARALDILASDYASATRGVTLEEINGGYQLRTKVDNADFLKRLQKVRPFRLSGPALETMAIVAYKQPVTKYEIDEIRGVESGHLLRALMERGLVQFAGKAEDKPGKPMAYGSTRKFLETFGLRNLRELPTLSEIDELLPEGIGEVEEKEKLSDITDELSNDFAGGYSDNEDELLKINDTLQQIDTTSEFFEQEKVRERDRRDRDRAQDLRERLVLGETVDPKDQRWLDRYEAKLHADAQAATTGTPGTVSAEDIEATAPITGDLESLTAEGGADEAEMAKTAAGDHAALSEVDAELSDEKSEDEEEAVGDLESNLDWDDDAEADDEDTSQDV